MNIEELNKLGITREQILEGVIEQLATEATRDQLLREIKEEVKKSIAEKANAAINKTVSEAMSEMLDKVFTPVDHWGDPKGEPVTIRDLFFKRCSEWWSQKVKSDGTPETSEYSSRSAPTMAQWQAEHAMKKIVAEEFPKQMGQLIIDTKQALAIAFTGQIADLVQKQLGLKR